MSIMIATTNPKWYQRAWAAADSLPTPHIIFSEEQVSSNFLLYRDIDPNVEIRYAVKACSIAPILKTAAMLQLGADCQSVMEAQLALNAGIDASRISICSPRLTVDDVSWLMNKGIKIIADSLSQFSLVSARIECGNARPNWSFGVRVSLPISATSRFHNKLGIEPKAIQEICSNTQEQVLARLDEIHHHGSARQTGDEALLEIAGSLGAVARSLEASLPIKFNRLNVGGGLDSPSRVLAAGSDTKKILKSIYKTASSQLDKPGRTVVFEPGRAIAKDAAVAITSVTNVKRLYGKNIAVVDISTNVLIPLPLAEFALVSELAPVSISNPYTVVDGTCSPAGVVINQVNSTEINEGDRLMISQVGAYTWSLAEPFYDFLPALSWLRSDGSLEQLFDSNDAKFVVERLLMFRR